MSLAKLPTLAKIAVVIISSAALLVADNKESSLYQWLTIFVTLTIIEVASRLIAGFALVGHGLQLLTFVW
jgi:hypothetical protein